MPSTPPSATFPVPPPVPRLQIVDDNKFPTPSFQEWCQLMWAAIQGQSGIIDDTTFSVLLQGVDSRVSSLAMQLSQVEMVALAAFCGASGSASSTPTPSADVVYAPLVTGELPGPTAIANTDGTFIMTRVE